MSAVASTVSGMSLGGECLVGWFRLAAPRGLLLRFRECAQEQTWEPERRHDGGLGRSLRLPDAGVLEVPIKSIGINAAHTSTPFIFY